MKDSVAMDGAERAAAEASGTDGLTGDPQVLQEAVRLAEAATQTAMDRLERVLREQEVAAARWPSWRRWLNRRGGHRAGS
jgi:hypothetical protein